MATAADPFVTVDEVKAHLRKTDTADDVKLAGFASAACQMIVDRIGQVSPVTAEMVAHLRPLRRAIILDLQPALSVTSVVKLAGDPIPAADPANNVRGWVLDAGAGVLTHTGWWPIGDIQVTYSAGRNPVPGNVRLAAVDLAGHLWKQSQLNNGVGRPPITGDDQIIMRGEPYALPYRVRELLGLGKVPTAEFLVG